MRVNGALWRRLAALLDSGVAQPPVERVVLAICLSWGLCLYLNPALMDLSIFAPHRSAWPAPTWGVLAIAAAAFELAGLTLRRFACPHWYVRWAGLSLMTAFFAGLTAKYLDLGAILVPWVFVNSIFTWLSFVNALRLFVERPPASGRGDGR